MRSPIEVEGITTSQEMFSLEVAITSQVTFFRSNANTCNTMFSNIINPLKFRKIPTDVNQIGGKIYEFDRKIATTTERQCVFGFHFHEMLLNY